MFHSVDPVSGKYIVPKLDDGTWWEFDEIAEHWAQITHMQGALEFHVPIPECGVILFFDHHYENRHTYLYRHALPPA